jgi:hypothetical protein
MPKVVEHIVEHGKRPNLIAIPGGWVRSRESDSSRSEQVKQCMDLQHCPHWLNLEPTHPKYPSFPLVLPAAGGEGKALL